MVALWCLWALGEPLRPPGDLAAWAAAADLDALVARLLRLLALAAGSWSVAATAAYGAATVIGAHGARRALRRVTVPVLRRAVDAVVGAALLAGTTTAPALAVAPAGAVVAAAPADPLADTALGGPPPHAASTPPPRPAGPPGRAPDADPEGADVPLVLPPAPGATAVDAPRTSGDEAVGGDGLGTAIGAEAGPPPTAASPAAGVPVRHPPTTRTIEPGESLWSVARDQLVGAGVPAPDDRTVHGYWVEVLAANAHGLRSGDPDLIYPGEVVLLPALPPVPP